MLLGRGHELALIDAALADARRRRSRAIVLRGEPGIGKSALLDAAETRAEGMTILRARGLQAESEIAFAALAELLRPVLDNLDAVPATQAAALSGALALGPSLPGDPFATSAATLSLLAATAERSPLLVVVDDAHWLDSSSATALLFAARRTHADGIAFLLAARDDEEAGFDAEGLEEIRLEGLDEDSARALLDRAAGREVDAGVAARLLAGTRGNPLALLEAPALLSSDQLAGRAPLDDPIPVGRTLERTFSDRVARLPEATRTALLVASASSRRVSEIAPALQALGLDVAALEAAERARLVSIANGTLAFRHPLLASAVYHGASANARRASHAALAEATTGEGRAWHLAAAAAGPDETAAQALEDAAESARGRGAHAAAAAAYERAAALSLGADARTHRMVEAAHDFQLAGRLQRSQALLDQALSAGPDARRRARIQELRARVELESGAPMSAHDLLVREADRIRSDDREKAVEMLAEASVCATFAAEPRAALAAAKRAFSLAHAAGPAARLLATVFLGWALLLPGEGRKAAALLAPYESALETIQPLPAAPLLLQAGAAWCCLEEYDKSRRLVMRVVDAGRAAGAPGVLALPLAVLADVDVRNGRWDSAYARATESLTLAEETGQTSLRLYGLTRLAAVEAGRGLGRACREHVASVLELAGPPGLDAALENTAPYLALLALGEGQPGEAIRHLEPLVRFTRERGIVEPAMVRPWGADLTEAYLRVGDRDHAERALADFAGRAERTGRRVALAAAARCRGLLADESSFGREFEDALALHEETDTPFERARTLLYFGERLRRTGRRRDARERLHDAHAVFEEVGAEPWAERARGELRASGETARRGGARTNEEEELTAQELQVALMIASGATNREAATALFLSPKTIEYHLTHVYGKLGLRSRSELARRFAREVEAPT